MNDQLVINKARLVGLHSCQSKIKRKVDLIRGLVEEMRDVVMTVTRTGITDMVANSV